MAIKTDRVELETDITRSAESVAEKGMVTVHVSSGSGVAIGASYGKTDWKADPSGFKVAGMLLNDVFSLDETLYHRNYHKDAMKAGEPSRLLRKGTVTTNKIIGAPTVGTVAYLGASGNLTPTKSATGGLVATPPVGEFKSIKDENGYVEVDVTLPFLAP